jgi:hypothetical protein
LRLKALLLEGMIDLSTIIPDRERPWALRLR